MQSNEVARLFVVAKTVKLAGGKRRQAGYYVCGFSKATAAPLELYPSAKKPTAIGLNGAFAFVTKDRGASGEGTNQGTYYNDVTLLDLKRRQVRYASTAGVRLSDMALSKKGVLAAVAESVGVQPEDDSSPTGRQEPSSRIQAVDVHDGHGKTEPTWQTLASAAPGTFQRLAVTPDGDTLLWSRSDGTAGTAPFQVRP
ncbi:MAG: hypothetical protein PGN13_13710 [Patulibacter minatonensis]